MVRSAKTVRSNPLRPHRQAIVGLVLVALVVTYILSRPAVESWTGWELPDLTRPAPQRVEPSPQAPDESSPSAATGRPQGERSTPVADGFPPDRIGRDSLVSPAGLVYGMGPRGEHRIEHILLHGRDDPSRPVHSVFRGDRQEIFALIDEAWTVAQREPRRAERRVSDGRLELTVDMRRVVGYEGGRQGKSKNYPDLRRIRLILEDDVHVVTAYPYR